ncbi:MAG: UDPGP type 1 family protein [Planctomycetes bacterium]|nr:UDPGP type 1 family protein [Planctomycetota bacterium]
MSDDVIARLRQHGQEHVLRWWDELSAEDRLILSEQLQSVDLEELSLLYLRREEKGSLPEIERIAALPRPSQSAAEDQKHCELGERAFRAGQVAFLIVAGGLGSRLGFEHPKGMFPVGPVSRKTLFQIHAEKVLALSCRYDVQIPLLVMTSPATDAETQRYFDENDYFGLQPEDVFFFCQGTMPALDLATGKLLMESKGRLFLGPNGHGGTLTGLADSGSLDILDEAGIQTIFYFQVDNPLADLADIAFLGRHVAERCEVSSKVITKESPTDKLGNFVLVDGRCSMIEYSDLPEQLARKTDSEGRLLFWAGNPAIHLFDVQFLRSVTEEADGIPWHIARKKVPHLDEHGNRIEPAEENALKFERFIFDVLPRVVRWSVVATTRAREFEPLKNATGSESPETVRRALSNLTAEWLERAGVEVPRDAKGNAAVALEVSPLFALDAEELAAKVKGIKRIEKERYFV